MEETRVTITGDNVSKFKGIASESCNTIIVSTFFKPIEKEKPSRNRLVLAEGSKSILKESCRILEYSGLLFVYGIPTELWLWAHYLLRLNDNTVKMLFKYWIALDIDNRARNDYLMPTHQGVLMFLKTRANVKNVSPFFLNTKEVRIPHKYCKACKQNLKDWGGKKHLMNPKGTCISDIWSDLPRLTIEDNTIPNSVIERIIKLTTTVDKSSVMQIVQREKAIEIERHSSDYDFLRRSSGWESLTEVKDNTVYNGDCITFLQRVSSIYPNGIFDLVFADPPYNLKKSYDKYDDERGDKEYIDWCNAWLYGMYKTLKPGGAFFVLNLPKWAISHAAFLNQYLDVRHWIVWDALSEPRGKILPAHYALLYYTKPGARTKFNYSALGSKPVAGSVLPSDSSVYCLRATCVKNRKLSGDDEKTELSDVWSDLHRIKHKRDRDAHPCQLPDSLMERIILLATNPGDLVFDPFGGAGTTATVSFKLGRRFVITEIDQKYVDISNNKISEMQHNRNLFGVIELDRKSTKRPKNGISKKDIETYVQQFARKLGKVPTEDEIQEDNPEVLNKIDLLYPNRGAALKRARIVLQT